MRRVKFIYNPNAGQQRIVGALEKIDKIYTKHNIQVVRHLLNFGEYSQKQIVDGLDSGDYEHVLIAGGDGTVNFVVTALRKYNIDIPIAIIPAGTANDFSRAIGMSRRPIRAVKQILAGEDTHLDLGCVNGRYFVNVFSFGLFTSVSQRTPTKLKNIFGKLAYAIESITELATIHKMKLRVTSDSGIYDGEALIMLVFNGNSAGNFKLAQMSELDDGLLEVLILRVNSPIETTRTFIRYLAGRGGKYPPKDVLHLRCSKLQIECEASEPTDVDGQPGVTFPAEVECLHRALRIIVPTKK